MVVWSVPAQVDSSSRVGTLSTSRSVGLLTSVTVPRLVVHVRVSW